MAGPTPYSTECCMKSTAAQLYMCMALSLLGPWKTSVPNYKVSIPWVCKTECVRCVDTLQFYNLNRAEDFAQQLILQGS